METLRRGKNLLTYKTEAEIFFGKCSTELTNWEKPKHYFSSL